MAEYTNEDWYKEELKKYLNQFGEVPPHWVIFPNTHPYSLQWRMGRGETFTMVFSNWFEDNFKEEKAKIDFFLKYPPPPRWLEVVAGYLWKNIPILGFENSDYLERLKALGFKRTNEYLKDIEDPKWLD